METIKSLFSILFCLVIALLGIYVVGTIVKALIYPVLILLGIVGVLSLISKNSK